MGSSVTGSPAGFWTQLLREPLLHFLALGAVLFGAWSLLHDGLGSSPQQIVVSTEQIRTMDKQFRQIWQRNPTREEQLALIDRWVHDEVLYREGLAMGLDRDDPVIRSRVGQKLAFMMDTTAPPTPSEPDLQAWLDEHPQNYRTEARYTLRQVYFDPGRHPQDLDATLAAALQTLSRGGSADGDPASLPERLDNVAASEVRRVFGDQFANTLPALAVGQWQGPVNSGYGVHLVMVQTRQIERPARLDEVRTRVAQDLIAHRNESARLAWFDALRARYAVRVEQAPVSVAAGDASP